MQSKRIAELEAEVAALKATLDKINGIRNSIVGFQIINWSEHIYPLVAALNEAGFTGEEYSEARPKAETLLERANAAEADTRTFRELVEEILEADVLPPIEPSRAWKARAEAALGGENEVSSGVCGAVHFFIIGLCTCNRKPGHKGPHASQDGKVWSTK